MYALIRFADNIYYACLKNRIRNNKITGCTEVKWTDCRYYPANVLVYNTNYSLLKHLAATIPSGLPVVELRKSDKLILKDAAVGVPPTSNAYNEKSQYDIPQIVTRNNLLENFVTATSSFHFEEPLEYDQTNALHTYVLDVSPSFEEEDLILEPPSLSVGTVNELPPSLEHTNYLENVGNCEDHFTFATANADHSYANENIVLDIPVELTKSVIQYEDELVHRTPPCRSLSSHGEEELNQQNETVIVEFVNFSPSHDNEEILNSPTDTAISEAVNSCQSYDNEQPLNQPRETVCFERVDSSSGYINEEMLNQPTQTVTSEVVVEPSITDINRSSSKNIVFKRREIPLPLQPDSQFHVSEDAHVDILNNGNTRRYFCIYCKKLYVKFAQHLVVSHKNEEAVKQFMILPSGNIERKKIIETIRRKGDYIHNTDEAYNSGCIYVARRPYIARDPHKYLSCPSCYALFTRKSFNRHMKQCEPEAPKDVRFKTVLGRPIHAHIHRNASYSLRERIFPILRDDECVAAIRYDRLAILLGNYWCSLYADQHYDDMIRARLRLIGRLLLTVKKLDSTISEFSSLFTPSRYDLVIAGINDVAGLSLTGNTYRAPTTATTIATICKKAADIWKIECMKSNDKEGKKNAENFLSLFQLYSTAAVNRTAMENRVQHQRQKVIEIPSKEDIQKLVSYLREKRRFFFQALASSDKENVNFEIWKSLASFTLVSVMVFNRRRPGEMERITLADYSNLKSSENISGLTGHFSSEESQLMQRYKRFEIRGKLNRVVPVLVDWEIEACVDLILSLREFVGISPNNPYVFGLPSVDGRHRYLRAYILIREYANQCGATKPHLLRGTELRKQIATECAIRDLSENVIRDVANFMGHAKNIHDSIYRLPINTRDIVQISKVLEMVEGGERSNNSDSESDDNIATSTPVSTSHRNKRRRIASEDCEQTHPPELTSTPSKTSRKHIASEDCEQTHSPERTSTPSKTSRKHIAGLTRFSGPKTPWSAEEKRAVLRNFGENLKCNKLPSSPEISERLPSIPELKHRSIASVKLWLANELKRRSLQSSSLNGTNIINNGKIKRTRWTDDMKAILLNAFKCHFKNRTLPSNRDCMDLIATYPVFEGKTIASIKTAVANELKRIK